LPNSLSQFLLLIYKVILNQIMKSKSSKFFNGGNKTKI